MIIITLMAHLLPQRNKNMKSNPPDQAAVKTSKLLPICISQLIPPLAREIPSANTSKWLSSLKQNYSLKNHHDQSKERRLKQKKAKKVRKNMIHCLRSHTRRPHLKRKRYPLTKRILAALTVDQMCTIHLPRLVMKAAISRTSEEMQRTSSGTPSQRKKK